MAKIVFVAGAHGVGKSYLSSSAATLLGMRYASASALIREWENGANWDKEKRTADIDRNQLALIAALNQLRKGSTPILLDGHFVLRDADGNFSSIGENVFKQLNCSAVILLTTPSDIVQQRLTHRGDFSWSMDEIHKLSQAELAQAIAICEALGVPLAQIESPDQEMFCALVGDLLRKSRRD